MQGDSYSEDSQMEEATVADDDTAAAMSLSHSPLLVSMKTMVMLLLMLMLMLKVLLLAVDLRQPMMSSLSAGYLSRPFPDLFSILDRWAGDLSHKLFEVGRILSSNTLTLTPRGRVPP